MIARDICKSNPCNLFSHAICFSLLLIYLWLLLLLVLSVECVLFTSLDASLNNWKNFDFKHSIVHTFSLCTRAQHLILHYIEVRVAELDYNCRYIGISFVLARFSFFAIRNSYQFKVLFFPLSPLIHSIRTCSNLHNKKPNILYMARPNGWYSVGDYCLAKNIPKSSGEIRLRDAFIRCHSSSFSVSLGRRVELERNFLHCEPGTVLSDIIHTETRSILDCTANLFTQTNKID